VTSAGWLLSNVDTIALFPISVNAIPPTGIDVTLAGAAGFEISRTTKSLSQARNA
jgi:hypothetical protein